MTTASNHNVLILSIAGLCGHDLSFCRRPAHDEAGLFLPTLDDLSGQGSVFPSAVATSIDPIAGHIDLFNGRCASADSTDPSMAELLDGRWRVALTTDRDFEAEARLWRGFNDVRGPRSVASGLPDATAVAREYATVNRDSRARGPMLTFLHFGAPNGESEADRQRRLTLVDAHLAEILDHVNLDRTLVCVVGGHTPCHPDKADAVGRFADARTLAPVILFGCGSRGLHAGVRSIADVAPTMLATLGVAPPPSMAGRNLFAGEGRVAYCVAPAVGAMQAGIAFRSDTYKLVRLCDGRSTVFCVSVEDGEESGTTDETFAARVRAFFEPHLAAATAQSPQLVTGSKREATPKKKRPAPVA